LITNRTKLEDVYSKKIRAGEKGKTLFFVIRATAMIDTTKYKGLMKWIYDTRSFYKEDFNNLLKH